MDPMMAIGVFLFFFGLFAFSMKIIISGKQKSETSSDDNSTTTRPLRIIAVIVFIMSLFIFLIFNRM